MALFTRGACASRSALYSESGTIHMSRQKVCRRVKTSGCEDEVDTSCNALITSCNQSSLRPCGKRWDGRRQVGGGGGGLLVTYQAAELVKDCSGSKLQQQLRQQRGAKRVLHTPAHARAHTHITHTRARTQRERESERERVCVCV